MACDSLLGCGTKSCNGVVLYLLVYGPWHSYHRTGSSSLAITKIIDLLSYKFSVKRLGGLNFFLGIEVLRGMLSQREYVLELLRKNNMLKAKPLPTLMNSSIVLSSDSGPPGLPLVHFSICCLLAQIWPFRWTTFVDSLMLRPTGPQGLNTYMINKLGNQHFIHFYGRWQSSSLFCLRNKYWITNAKMYTRFDWNHLHRQKFTNVVDKWSLC